ncbi:carboxylate-amine ligase, partial [Streptomyces sp. Act-28]
MVAVSAAREVTLGVEEEFLLVDAVDGSPVGGCGDGLAADRGRHRPDGGAGPGFQRELLSTMVETATGVCTDLAGLRAELTAARTRLDRAAREAGLRPLASGTAPMSAPARTVTPTRHYRQMARLYGRLADETETCGCHVHVGVPDRESAVAVLNHLRPWLPVLLALSANSPYHQGADTGHASWRALVLSRWPTHQIPPRFASAEQYDRTVAALRRTGVLPARAGNAYWFARPSDHLPTVEVRIADVTPSVDEAVLQAGLTCALVTTALGAVVRGRP